METGSELTMCYDQEQLLIFKYWWPLNLHDEVVPFPDMEFVTLDKFSTGAIRIHE